MQNHTASSLRTQFAWVNKIRPMSLGAVVADLVAPERRKIISTDHGFCFYADSLSQLGGTLLSEGHYEQSTEQLLRSHLRPGDAFLDIGANEGYFTTVGASLVGDTGYVAAVEPQSRLAEIITINLALNKVKATLFQGALGGDPGQQADLFYSPSLNTGYSSLVEKPVMTRKKEAVPFVDPSSLLGSRSFFSLAKIDVEGFEAEVIQSLMPLLQQGLIHCMLLDYHADVLARRNINPTDIENSIFSTGMTLLSSESGYTGFRVYARSSASA